MIPLNATISLQEKLQLQHDKGWRIYDNTGTMDEDLNKQVVDTFEDTYLNYLKHKYT